MKPIEPEIVERAVTILGTHGIAVDDIEDQVAALVPDPMEARRLVDWILEAFGMVLASHLGKPIFTGTFSARNDEGEWKSFPLSCEPIFATALAIAQSAFPKGPREVFMNVAIRSATFNSINNLLNAGGSIDGAVNSGPALIGIPAETYPEQPQSFLQKLLPIWRRVLAWYSRRSDEGNRHP